MKQEKDITNKARDIIAQVEALPAIPATTPAMMAHYRRHLQLSHSNKELLIGAGVAVLSPRLTAAPNTDPFIIRLSNPIHTKGQVAYLSLANGTVEWRHARSAEIDLWVYVLNRTERLEAFLCWVSQALDKDGTHFRYAVCRERGEDTVFYQLRFRKREAEAFPADKKQPILYLANMLNCLVQPDYELRRFTDPKLGKGGIPHAADSERMGNADRRLRPRGHRGSIQKHIKTTNGRRRAMGP